ncbi:MAG: hypothetical protein WA635_07945 [Gallionella sp.]
MRGATLIAVDRDQAIKWRQETNPAAVLLVAAVGENKKYWRNSRLTIKPSQPGNQIFFRQENFIRCTRFPLIDGEFQYVNYTEG